jgi:hypothetical protein
VSIARWNLKESEGKALAQRTEITYEAFILDEEAVIFKVQYLYGKHSRRCGGHKCESERSYPGRSVYPLQEELRKPEGGRKGTQKSAKGIVKLWNRKLPDVPDRTRPLEDRERKERTDGPAQEAGAAEGLNV